MELPHTAGCLACGRENPHGLHLHLFVDDAGVVSTTFTPTVHHIGFEGVAHGGVLATVLDEAMVWAATWAGKRFCLCGEMSIRFRQPALVGQTYSVEARVELNRSRIIRTAGLVKSADGTVVAESTGTYVPLPAEKNREFVATLVIEPATKQSCDEMTSAAQ